MDPSPHRFEAIDWALWQPTCVATILFVVQDGRLLLIHKKRGLGAGKINGPGGRLEPGETPHQCAVREVREELGIQVLDACPRGELRFQFTDGLALLVYVFSATRFEGDPYETDEAKPLWTDLDAIPYDRMWADDRLWLPLMLDGHRFEGCFLFDDDAMLGHDIRLVT